MWPTRGAGCADKNTGYAGDELDIPHQSAYMPTHTRPHI